MAAIDAFFDTLIQKKGSDLHLAVGRPPTLRQRGALTGFRKEPLGRGELESLLFEILSAEQKRELEAELDLDFAYAYADKARFRASYFYKKSQDAAVPRELGAVFRLIPSAIPTLDDLACPPAIRALAERRSGLVLVTGPTGSGKSTTLAAMIRHINESRPCHILTIEDPIEFVHAPAKAQITQREIGRHAPDFPTAILSAGREDADVILIGELRTNETMKMALQLASFGLLIFGTVHTNSAPATIDRIINAFPGDEQPMVRGLLATSLTGIVAQQLVPTKDGGSQDPHQGGGPGRCAAHEILIGSPALATMIRDEKTFQVPSLMQSGGGAGMQTMDVALAKLVASGKISREHALEKASDKESFAKSVADR
jgi:twitching motility protein PilT